MLDLVRIQAAAVDTNVGSQRVLDRCGFVREGMLRSYRLIRGEPRDFWKYSTGPLGGTSARARPDTLKETQSG